MKNKNFEILEKLPTIEKLKGRIKGKNILIRAELNVYSENGVIADTTRADYACPVIKFLIKEGATPVLCAHNGRLNKKTGIDKRQSLKDASLYLQTLFPELKVVFHENSVVRGGKDGLMITRDDIVKGAINIIENVRFDQAHELGEKRQDFACALVNLSEDKIFIFDGFGSVGSKGASVEDVPKYANEVYVGPAMAEEFELLKSVIGAGIDGLIFGGEKLDKVEFLKGLLRVINPGGFALIGSGPSYAIETGDKEVLNDLEKAGGQKMIMTKDYSHEELKPPFDIGPKTIELFLQKLDSLKKGQTVVYNGTMGIMEDDYNSLLKNFPEDIAKLISTGVFKEGTEAVVYKLIELAKQGVKVIIIGGDAAIIAKKYRLDQEENAIKFTGGGVPVRVYANEVLSGLGAMYKRFLELQN